MHRNTILHTKVKYYTEIQHYDKKAA